MKLESQAVGDKRRCYRRAVPALYFIALAAMTVIVLMNILLKEPSRPDEFGLDGFTDLDTGWYTAAGDAFEIAEIDALRPDGSDTVSLFHHLPAAMTKDETLFFRSKNCTVTVLVDGVAVYASDMSEAPFYNHSPGTRWNAVTIQAGDAGKAVDLQVRQAYEDGRAKVDNFYFGDRAAIVLHLIGAKLWGCVISMLIFFVALVFLCAWLVLNWGRRPKNHSLFWLALFALAAACWCLLETNLFQLFAADLRLIQVVDNMMLVVAAMPIFLYLDSIYGVFESRFVRLLCGLDLGYILLATLSQLLGLWDFHQSLNGAIATFGVVAVVLIVCLMGQHRVVRPQEPGGRKLFFSLQQLGILLLGLGLLGDLVRYLVTDVLDRAFIIRIGLLFFVICFGAGNLYEMILLVKRGLEADLVGQLAYVDGLTRTGNRTAYLEQLQRLAAERGEEGLGLVMFDVNNLKVVNDTLGHKEGDDLLLDCAAILQASFGSPWKVYRIGGDEFIALVCGDDAREAYQNAETRFTAELARVNGKERPYPVAIAHGAAFCPIINRVSIEATQQEADRRMYQDKAALKRAAVTPM